MPSVSIENQNVSSSSVEEDSSLLAVKKPKLKKSSKKKNPKLTNKINPEFIFPQEPNEFKDRYMTISWGSAEHDELGKKLFKTKENVTHCDEFGKYFPRYSVVKQNSRASKPYARRKLNAFLHKSSSSASSAQQQVIGDNGEHFSEE